MTVKHLQSISMVLLSVGLLSLTSCNFWSRSSSSDHVRHSQEFDPISNSWTSARSIPTPEIHPQQPDPRVEQAPESPTSGGVIQTLKKPLGWIPGIN